MNSLKRIQEIGFKYAGYFEHRPDMTNDLNYHLEDEFKKKRCIYAIVVNSNVRYIGSMDSAKTTLYQRMSFYRSGSGGGRNQETHGLILEHVTNDEKVEIYAYIPDCNIVIAGIKVDVIRGMENSILRSIMKIENNLWNKRID